MLLENLKFYTLKEKSIKAELMTLKWKMEFIAI